MNYCLLPKEESVYGNSRTQFVLNERSNIVRCALIVNYSLLDDVATFNYLSFQTVVEHHVGRAHKPLLGTGIA